MVLESLRIKPYNPHIALIMCKKCVQALDSISEGMSHFLKSQFQTAVIRDMSREMDDEEGMFHVFMFEQIACELKPIIDEMVIWQLADDTVEMLLKGIMTPLMDSFQNQWA
jgi:hypothetical protein